MAENIDPALNSTIDRDTDLEQLRNGGPTSGPGIRTTTGGTAGPASVAALRAGAPAPGTEDAQDTEDEVREAQEAHGGSMAPGLVDATGHPTGDAEPRP